MSTVVILASCGADRDPAGVTIERSAIVDPTSFNAPGNIGGGGPIGGPGVSSQGVNQIDVFYRKADQVLWHFSWTGLHWSTPESLGGGTIASDPASVSWGPGRIDVVALAVGSNAILHRWFEGGKWSAYESLGGVGTSAPVISSPGPGKLDVFVAGTDKQLWQKSFNGTWSAWIPLGGYLTSDPAAVSSAPGTTFVFARSGADNALWYTVGVGNIWSAWKSLGGVCSSAPAASSPGNGRVDVFVRGSGNNYFHRAYAGNTWTDYENIGGVYASRPAAVSWGAGRIDVFGQADGTMFHQYATRTPFPIPAGSYQQSCINISFDGVTLWAECPSPDGFSGAYTSVEYSKCVTPPANIYGGLTCATGAPPPSGSYLATCHGVNILDTTVSAYCLTRSGVWSHTSLNFSNCVPGSIWNNDGALTCSTGSSTPPPPPPPNTCTVSALVTLGTCYDLTGEASSILPSGISDMGCGSTESIAVGNGLFALEASVGCITSQPTAGCCTYTSQTYQGCYCQ